MRGGNGWGKPIHKWNDAQNLWRARASLVSFEKVSDNKDYRGIIDDTCRKLIKREERFAKIAVGWLLREISKHDDSYVKSFIKEHMKHFSNETIGNALKYSTKEEQKHYLTLLKEV